jgi:uncharacterized protein (TIRG00374 family)
VKGRFAIGLLVSLVLLALLLRQVPPHDVAAAFRSAAPLGLLLTLGLHVLVLSLKALRWAVVLRAVPHPAPEPGAAPDPARRWLVFDALFFGYFGNYVLPAKLGEFGRSLLYGRRSGVPVGSVFATIVFERMLDALTLLLGFYAVVLFLPLPQALPHWVHESIRGIAAVSLLGLCGLVVAERRLPRDAEEVAISGLPGRLLKKAVAVAATFRRGLLVLESPRVAALAAAWTLVIWSFETLAAWVCLRSFGADLPLSAALLQVVLSSFAIAAPSAPGGLGIHQAVTEAVLDPYGVAGGTAIAASLVLTFAVVFWVVPIGLFGLWRQGMTTAELKREAARPVGAESAEVRLPLPSPGAR